jgi:RNA polymerase sigma-70 factor (ECF subfamily)
MINRVPERVRWIEQHLLPYEPRIRAWLNRNHISGADADDIVHEMYARIGSVDNFDEIREPLHYAIKVAHSILINQVRRSQIVPIVTVSDPDIFEIACSAPSPEDEAEARDELEVLAHALASLPRRTRDVLLLRRVEGLSQRATAAKLGIAEKTVEKHIARAVLYLARQFGRGGKVKAQTSLESGKANGEDDEIYH